MFLPACDRCGQCGCSCGRLPYTMTVRWSGLVNKTHSAHCDLAFTSDFGCGAKGVGMSPGGCVDGEPACGEPDKGPLTAVLLTDGGHDYARLGRVQPTLTIGGGGGTGATFTPTLVAIDDTLAEQCRSYKLASVAVSGGTGYTNGQALTIEADGTTVTKAVALVVTNASRVQPTVTASVAGVSGESLSVTLKSNGDAPETWGVEAVSVTTAGSGWNSNEWTLPVTFATSDTKVTDATATATKQVVSPGAEYVGSDGSGTGLSATVTLQSQTCDDGHQCFAPTAISITSGGTGYVVGEVVEFRAVGYDLNNGIEGVAIYTVESVTGSGEVTGLSEPTVLEPFRKLTGVGSITVDTKGAYYALSNGGSGAPASVTVTNPGEYYKEDQSAPVCVANVTVDASACGGTDAVITATIGDDPEDKSTWGKITGLTIDEGGDDYLCWNWICDGLASLNDEDIILAANNPKKLVTLGVNACHGSGACIKIVPTGEEITCGAATFNKAYSGGLTPIREINLESGGSNYAMRGREVPQWTAVSYGWTFTPTFGDQQEDSCGLPWWPVESFAVTSGSGGTQPDGWMLQHGSLLTSPEFLTDGFLAIVRTRQEPTSITVAPSGPGSGATLTAVLSEVGGQPKRWRVSAVSGSGGSGYINGSTVQFSVPPRGTAFGHYVGSPASAVIQAGEGGEITNVTVTNGGSYWLDDGIPQSVEVLRGGRYYRENSALEPYVADVTVSVDQLSPSSGSGAAISVVVEDDTSSANFGKIISASLDSQGSGYTLLGGPMDCSYSTGTGDQCETMAVHITLRGANRPPDVSLTSFWGAEVVARADYPLDDCNTFPPSATLLYGSPAGVTATVTAGGEIATECGPPEWCVTGNDDCNCPADDSPCPTVPFTLVCDGNAGECIPGGRIPILNTPFPPAWFAEGATATVPDDPNPPLFKANAAGLRCYSNLSFINEECPPGSPNKTKFWVVSAVRGVSCHPISTDFFASQYFYAIIECDTDGWPVAGVVNLIEGRIDGPPSVEVGALGDCGQRWLDVPVVEITRP